MTLMTNLGFRPAFLDFATMTIYPSEAAAGMDGTRATLIAIRLSVFVFRFTRSGSSAPLW